MADLNEVRLIGRLTRDPETKSTATGTAVCSFGIATSREYQDKKETLFVDVTAWGKLADLASQYLRKGRLCYIGGRLKFDQWDDRSTGQKRNKISVVAENIQFLDKGEKQDAPSPQEPPATLFPEVKQDEPPF